MRRLLLFEAATFIVACLVHSGLIVSGYEHARARIAEAVLATVLVVGAAITWMRPAWTRTAAVTAQTIALIGTLIGIFTIVIGVGPRTVPDIVYHVGILVVLVTGLAIAQRTPRSGV